MGMYDEIAEGWCLRAAGRLMFLNSRKPLVEWGDFHVRTIIFFSHGLWTKFWSDVWGGKAPIMVHFLVLKVGSS